MRRFAPPAPSRSFYVRLFSAVAIAVGLALTTISAQIPGRNVNMVSGTTYPDGDPFLQRQNEPSIAASTRNPLHLLGGSNDYRTVDIPGLCTINPVTGKCIEPETGDAWLGLFKSKDGGQRWTSTLHPGYPQDLSEAGRSSPLKGYQAGADAVVRAGTHGLIYYSGLVFDRGENNKSAVFLSRFIDNNNQEAGDPFAFLGTSLVVTSTGQPGTPFLDKPWMAVDIPRPNSTMCIVTDESIIPTDKKAKKYYKKKPKPGRQRIPAGPIYVTYTAFTGEGATLRSEVMLKRSTDCGATWSQAIRVSNQEDHVNQGTSIAIDPRNGAVYVAYRRFDPDLTDNTDLDAMMVARLPYGAGRFDPPGRAHKFKKPQRRVQRKLDHLFEHRGDDDDGERRNVRPGEIEDDLDQFDLGTSGFNFRTNAYPTMAADGTGRIYIAWTQRGFGADTDGDDGARLVITSTHDGRTFAPLKPIEDHDTPGRGHQLMPSMTFAGGKLMLVFYDIRETHALAAAGGVHDRTISDANKMIRHTIDIRSAMALPADSPNFAESVQVSEYQMGFNPRSGQIEELQANPPNLPMFQKGTVPFMGDYIDVAAAPAFLPDASGKWGYNTEPSGVPPVFHAAWTDNRDVRPPTTKNAAGKLDWTQYTPAKMSPDQGPRTSIFLPGAAVPECTVNNNNAGSRNQNVYSARITGTGLIAGSPGNTKPLSTDLQRGFVVFATNTQSGDPRSFRMRILNQPPGGRASFEQFPLPPYTAASPAPETAIEMIVPPRSTASRTVYITSSDPNARVTVAVVELVDLTKLPPSQYPGAAELPGGAEAVVMLNPDIENPDIENPDFENPDIENPDIENAEVYNPDIENPDIENPDIENPDIENPDIENPDIENPDIENPDIENVRVSNPDIENPDIENPDIENPDIENPDIENPDIENPDIENGAIADVTWTVTNTGNTTAAFNVNLFLAQQKLPASIATQLVLLKTYRTPVTVPNGCQLAFQTRNVLVTNIANPILVAPNGAPSNPNDPDYRNATLWLSPGEEGRIVLRVFDNDTSDNVLVPKLDQNGNPILDKNGNPKMVSIDATVLPTEDVTPVVQQQSVNTEDAEAGITDPPIVTPTGSNLFFLQQPTTTVVNATMAPPVRVRVIDNTGAAVPAVAVTLSLNVPGVVISGNAAVTDATGVATFAALQINTPGTGYILTAVAGGATPASAQSNAFSVLALVLDADLEVTQASTPPILNTNTTITLTVTNHGPVAATGVVLTDTLPAAATFITVTDDNCSYNPDLHTVTCPVGSLAIGASREYGIVIRPTAAQGLTNAASVNGTQPDQNAADNSSSEILFVSSYAPCSSPTFRGPYVTPLNSTSTGILTTADFNEDTFPDMLFAQSDGNFVLVLSDGAGGFQEPQYFEENNPVGATTADFNNDGHADVAVISANNALFQQPAEFGVGLGDGTGNFPGGGEDVFLPLAATFAVESGDFNHDGNADVVVSSANVADTTVVVLLGAGDGTFGAPISVPAGTQPGNIVLGDFNRDGHLDIAVNNIGVPTVSILRGDGEGGFSAPQTITVPVNSQRLRQMNDVNGDGAPDLAVTTSPGGGVLANLLLLMNDGAGTFPTATEIIGSRGVGFTTTGDMNGDGRLDVVAIVFPENRLVILEGDGAGQFTETASYLNGPNQNHFAIVDLNVDGRPDIVGGLRGAYYLLFNTCAGDQGATADLDSTVLGPDSGAVGDQLTYTAFVANNGPDPATNVVATFVVPAGMNFINSSIDCVVSYGTLQCNLPTIEPEANESFTVTVQAFAAGTRVNRLMATATEADPDSSNNVGGANTTIAPGAFAFVVTNTADAGLGTLRQAISDSNLNAGSTNQIHFNISGDAPFVITPQSGLPTISVPVIIDGTTQPGYTDTPLIELTGINTPGNGLNINAGNTTVRGLSLTRWGGNAINVTTNGNNVFEGNYVGLTPAGVVSGNGTGINLVAPNNRVGGTAPTARNVISGNNANGVNIGGQVTNGALVNTGAGSIVLGNYIGTNPAGTAAAAAVSGASGVRVSVPNVTIGSTLGPNVISGNGASGSGRGVDANAVVQATGSTVVLATSTNLVVQSNFIGTDATGTAAIPNVVGVQLNAGGGRIGGANAGEGNLISGNTGYGLNFNIQTTGGTSPVFVTASSNYVVEGNFIGLNASGAALPNNVGGISVLTSNNTIGGLTAGAGNVIAGNGTFGINLTGTTSVTPAVVATGNTVVGNRIGTNPAGTTAIANGSSGINFNNNANNNVIGGTAPGSRNLISGNGANGAFGAGVNMSSGSHHNTVQGNLIGTNANGTAALPNANGGIEINNSNDNLVGGTTAAARNIISGNGSNTGQPGNAADGVGMFGTSANNQVQGNFIGTDITGTAALANTADGVLINATGAGNAIGSALTGSPDAGAANTIAFNAVNGVGLSGSPSGVAIRGNSIFSNGSLGIDLGRGGVTANDALDADTGPNGFQNFPVFADVRSDGTVSGTLRSTPSTTFELDFYANVACETNGFGEGRRYLGFGSAATDAGGIATFEFSIAPPAGSEVITATATAAEGTSEFSACATPSANGQFVVTNTDDSGPGSLRQAILDANSGSSLNTIAFNIPGAGPHRIQLTSASPIVFAPVIIDGYTQPGSAANTLATGSNAIIMLELRGTGTGGFNPGFNLVAPSTVKGFAVGNFSIGFNFDQFPGTTVGHHVEGNFIGVSATGAAMPNNHGIEVRTQNHVIGGATLAARNVISGNLNTGIRITAQTNGATQVFNHGGGTTVINNLIGTAPSGLTSLGNLEGITVSVPDVTIGGPSAALGNVISGNGSHGISSFPSSFDPAGPEPPVMVTAPTNFVVQGNRIGVNINGTALANAGIGVNIHGPSIIGGTAGVSPLSCTGACNVISGNLQTGLNIASIFDAATGVVVGSGAGTQVFGNYIGLNASGTAAAPNGSGGIFVGVPNVIIGGADPLARNVISGNNGTGINASTQTLGTTPVIMASGAVIKGNYVGLGPDGETRQANVGVGIRIAVPNVTVGGPTALDRNVIAGNAAAGIFTTASMFDPDGAGALPAVPLTPPVVGSDVVIRGNYVGTNALGTTAVPNVNGVSSAAARALIANNVVSGNILSGLTIASVINGTTGEIYSDGSNALVIGNRIGVKASGDEALPNTGSGVSISAPNAVIGGNTAAERNIISGNLGLGILIANITTSANVLVTSGQGASVRGNYIGVTPSGAARLSNGLHGIQVEVPNVTIGGGLDEGNVIVSGDNQSGVSLTSTGGHPAGNSTVRGNIIGLDASQIQRLNGGIGISVSSAGNTITQNVIAGNGVAPAFVSGISINPNGNNNIVKGNIVGTNPSGHAGLGNAGPGISIDGGSGNTIGGSQPGERNILSGNGQHGLILSAQAGRTTNNNVVHGNFMGANHDGVTALPNGAYGVRLFANAGGTVSGNIIGGAPGEGNLLSGNGLSGANLGGGAGTTNNQILGNRIGTINSGAGPLPNRNGIFIGDDTNNNTIGSNLIAFNNEIGVITPRNATGNRIVDNSIHSNGQLGIDLNGDGPTANDPGDGDTGGNNQQNFPVLSAATNSAGPTTRVTADLTSFAAGNYTVQFFASNTCDASGFGEGERLVGHFTGQAAPATSPLFLNEAVAAGQFITATATDANGNTSEFSACTVVDSQ